MQAGETLENSPVSEENNARGYTRLTWILATVAIGIRAYHYLRNNPVWCDELWILRNIVGKSFLELLGPLTDIQAAPPLFLWIERVVYLLFGPSTYVMRLIPFLASCSAVLLLVPLGRRCLSPRALPWAILLMGCSESLMNYACEVKPYAIDALLGVALPLAFLATAGWRFRNRILLFTMLAPVVIFLSYPGCFLYGGVMTAFLPDLWMRRHRWQSWLGCLVLACTTFLSFFLLLIGPVQAQHTASLKEWWIDWPNWHHPWSVPLWSLDVLFRFLEFIWRPTGMALLVPALLGLRSFWQRRQQRELVLFVVPGLLTMLAAWIHAYPFESRVILYLTGSCAILCAEGIRVMIDDFQAWLSRCDPASIRRRRQALVACRVGLALVLLIPLGLTFYRVISPSPRMTVEVWPEKTAQNRSDR